MRIVLGLCLTLVLVAAMPGESSAQAAAGVITFEVPAAQAGAFVAAIARGSAILERHAPGSESNLWQPIVNGPNVGQFVYVVSYPSLEAWAAARAKIVEDPEFLRLQMEMAEIGAELVSNDLSVQVMLP